MLHRGGERRVPDGRRHHPVPGGGAGGGRRISRVGGDGLPDRRRTPRRRGGGDRQPLRRSPAHHPDEAAERERGAGHDARRDEYLRGRLVRGTLGVDCPRLGGYDALRGRALLRECGDTEDEVHRGVLAAGGPGGGIDGDIRRVPVLRIENKKRGTDSKESVPQFIYAWLLNVDMAFGFLDLFLRHLRQVDSQDTVLDGS